MASILRIENLTKEYRTGGEVVHALRGVSVSIDPGRFVGIMGASGSGKSTLLHLAGGLDVPTGGTVEVEGHELSKMSDRKRTLFRRQRLGIIFQAYNLLPMLTARENIALPLLVDGVAGGVAEEKVEELIARVHLEHRASHHPQAMSGGEQQRVAIARALLKDPALILADEPTGNLDSTNAVEIWQLLRQLTRELGKTVLMVSHEAAGAAYTDEVLVLKDGQLVGRIEPKDETDAALVANRYQELAG
jgi:putative ABC transport system ATP-binding protein